MSRRRLITGVVLALMPLGATASAQEYKAQQANQVRRIGVLMNNAENDPLWFDAIGRQLAAEQPSVAECDLGCQELTATGFPGIPGHIAAVYAEFLRRRFSPIPRRNDRRLYLSRRGFRRNFENAETLESILQQYGFEEVLAHQDPDTLQKCAEAALVFSVEGANFFNAVFCPAGTRVLVVVPDRLPHNVPFALTLAEACGFPTFLMSGNTVGPPGVDGGVANVHLDPDKLRHGLERLGAALLTAPKPAAEPAGAPQGPESVPPPRLGREWAQPRGSDPRTSSRTSTLLAPTAACIAAPISGPG